MNFRYISVPHQQHQIGTLYKGFGMTENTPPFKMI